MLKRFSSAAAIAAIYLFVSPTGAAEDLGSYRKFREERFAAVRQAGGDLELRIQQVKQETAKAVAAAPRALGALDAPALVWRVAGTGSVVYDLPVAPRMVIVPAGEFTMGPSLSEHGTSLTARRRVRIAQPFAMSMFPITFAEISLYVAETGHKLRGKCASATDGTSDNARDWNNPGFAQSFRSPATCIAYEDAAAYADWLSAKTGKRYRLATEAEYEYANRAGTTTRFWWGDDPAGACAVTNGREPDAAPAAAGTLSCHDSTQSTTELGKSKANPFGLFDTAGNVASWTSDCWKHSSRRPAAACRYKAVRGSSWASTDLRSARREKTDIRTIRTDLGFRLVREL